MNPPKEISNVLPFKPSELASVERALAIRDRDPWETDEVGFLTRELVQVGLPHDNPGTDKRVWTRRNGNLVLSIQPKFTTDRNGNERCIGYPYGNIPRLILIYLVSEARRTGTPEIELDRSLRCFLENRLHTSVTGGANGSITRFKNQARRLFTAHIDFTYGDEEETGFTVDEDARIAQRVVFWWNDQAPNQYTLFDNYVVLSPRFFQQVINHPVPLDLAAIRELQQSSLALDLYTWLTHRVSYLKKPQIVSWKQLMQQTGTSISDAKNFKRMAKKYLRRIEVMWDGLNLEQVRGGLMIKPSRPHVPKRIIALSAPSK